MPEEKLPYGHRQALRRREPGSISGLLQDIGAFEELPERMRWIRYATVCERVGLQKITKFIVDGWFGDGPDWEKRRPQEENQHPQPHPTQSLVTSESRKG